MVRQIDGRRPLIVAGIILGVGLGGFVDGILFHQILQWHHMVSSVFPTTTVLGLEINTLWDGLFHVFAWTATLVGLVLLWRLGRRRGVPWSTRVFVGSLLLGAGAFNVVEGLVDHHILGIHHVREGVPNQLAWDLGFLVAGALLFLVGAVLIRSDYTAARARPVPGEAAEQEGRRAA